MQRKREERKRNRSKDCIDNRSKSNYYKSANHSENRDYRYKKQRFVTEIKINDKKNIFRAYNVEHATKDENVSSASNSYENNYSNEIVEENFENENHVEVNVIDIVSFNAQIVTDTDRDYRI